MKAAHPIVGKLSTEHLPDIDDGLAALERETQLLRGEHGRELLAAVFPLFLIDTVDYPELERVIRRAEKLIASMGTDAVPFVLAQLNDSDIKGHVHLVRTLIRIGMPAVPQIITYHDACTDPLNRAFALYALSKMADPGIAQAIPLVIKDMSSKHIELRDTATRSLGKIIEVVSPARVSHELKTEMADTTLARTTDPIPGVRAKALRTLGKLSRFGFLTEEQSAQTRRCLEKALGRLGTDTPDRAFIVRREAEIALAHLG